MNQTVDITMIMVMSADGIIVKNKEDVIEWSSKEDQQHLNNILLNYDAIITGRKSFFGRIVEKPYYVLTSDIELLKNSKLKEKNVKYITGNVKDIMTELQNNEYKKVALLGGPVTNYNFLKEGLVRDIYLTVENKMFGKGKHLNIEKELNCNLFLENMERLNPQGTILLHYKVENSVMQGADNPGAPQEVPDVSDNDLMSINKEFWNERAPLHEKSEYYDVNKIVEGNLSLVDYEIKELGDIKDKSLLHLQCHIGTETISLARLGADVTGLDYSASAITIAEELNKKCHTTCKFICADVYDVKKMVKDRKYDIVYVNFGAITLLPDLKKWASLIYDILKPDGYLYLNELHPVSSVLSVNEPLFVADYFNKKPRMFEESGSYTDGVEERFNQQTAHNKLVVWDRTLGEIISTIAEQGFRINYVHEYSGYVDQRFHYLEKGHNGLWYSKNGRPNTPATFSLKASKV